MSTYTVSVMLQFPMMPRPLNVEVTPRQLYYLDRHAERRLTADGTAIYFQSDNSGANGVSVH